MYNAHTNTHICLHTYVHAHAHVGTHFDNRERILPWKLKINTNLNPKREDSNCFHSLNWAQAVAFLWYINILNYQEDNGGQTQYHKVRTREQPKIKFYIAAHKDPSLAFPKLKIQIAIYRSGKHAPLFCICVLTWDIEIQRQVPWAMQRNPGSFGLG